MLAEVAVAPLSLPWCKSRCSSPEYRWHYTSNPLNGWDTLTCWCLEWPASISGAFARPIASVNVTANNLQLGYGSGDISSDLSLTFSSPENVLHWVFFYFLRCQWDVRTSSNLCRKLEQLLPGYLTVACTVESILNGKCTAWMPNHGDKIEFWRGVCSLVPSLALWWFIGLNVWQLTLNTVGKRGWSPEDFQ